MDISGPIREALRGIAPAADSPDPLGVFVRAIAFPDEPITEVPLFLAPGTFFPFKTAPDLLPAQQWFTLACVLRLLPRVSRNVRDHWIDILAPQLAPLPQASQLLLVSRTTRPLTFLWHYWLLTLAQQRLKITAPDMLLKGLWRRGLGMQSMSGQLHTSTPPAPADVQDDLCALHAAFNAVIFSGQTDLLPPVEALLQWLVRQTASTSPEAWALAAFAALDDTQTIAPRQLHSALAQLRASSPSLIPALLADALATQEESAR